MLLRLGGDTTELEQKGANEMARVKLSALISDIRGKLNGSVFQLNNGILSLRKYSTPTNSKQPSAELNKIVSSVIQSEWLQLSDSDRAGWNTYASIVKKSTKNSALRFMSGQALFAHINFYQYVINGTLLTYPVGYNNNTSARVYGLFVYGGSLFLSVDSAIDNSICYPFITLTHPVQPSRNHSPESGRKITFNQLSGSLINITNSYYASYGFSLRPNDCVLLNSIMIDAITGLTGYRNNQKLIVQQYAPYDQVKDSLAWAYSCRLLLSDYSGVLFTVQRDNSEDTFNVDVADWINNYSNLLAWLGNDDCFVVTMYNQLNNGESISFDIERAPSWSTLYNCLEFDEEDRGTVSNSFNFNAGESMAIMFNMRYDQTQGGYILGQVNRTLDNYIQYVALNDNNIAIPYNACNYDFSTSAFAFGIRSTPDNSFYNSCIQVRVVDGNTYVDNYINNDVITIQAIKQIIGYFDAINDDGLGGNEGCRVMLRDIVAINTFLSESQIGYINQFYNL